jgi:hypothetical protein
MNFDPMKKNGSLVVEIAVFDFCLNINFCASIQLGSSCCRQPKLTPMGLPLESKERMEKVLSGGTIRGNWTSLPTGYAHVGFGPATIFIHGIRFKFNGVVGSRGRGVGGGAQNPV